MRKLLYTLLILLFSFGCSPFKRVAFKTDTFMSAGKEFEFEWNIPRGYKKYTSDLYHHLLKRYEYSDSTVLYISLDINYANSPNQKNWMKCSRPQENYKCEGGQQDDGQYWKDILSNNLVVGYYNVGKADKEMFDKTLSTLKKKK